MKIKTLCIIGVGLIGGSIGLAAKKRWRIEHVVGIGRSQTKLDLARSMGAIDEGYVDPARAMQQAEVAVFCTPVDRIADQVLAFGKLCAPGTLLTDAGSTKARIMAAVEGKLHDGISFVGSHPLAGSEKQGAEHADADLFVNRWTIITPAKTSTPAAIEKTENFWRALGARVRVMTAAEHDRSLAITSHVPHLTAAALAGILPRELHDLTATGFRDTTRVAAGDPGLWSAIFSENREPVLTTLAALSERLHEFRRALEADDRHTIERLLNKAKEVRDALGN